MLTFSPVHLSVEWYNVCFCLFPCRGRHVPFQQCVSINDRLVNTDCKSHLWMINVALILATGTASDSVIASFMCKDAKTCTRQLQYATSTFLSWSISYTWHRLICSKGHESNINTLELVWSLVDKRDCKHKPVHSLHINSVQRSQCDGEIKTIIVSLLKVTLKASLVNAVRLISVLHKGFSWLWI